MDEILISILVILCTLGFAYFLKARVRPIQLVGNEMQFAERVDENRQRQQPIHNLAVQSCQVPFVCVLNEPKSSINDGLFFKIKLSELNFASFNIVVAWAVEIDSFYNELQKSVKDCFFNENERKFLQNYSKKVNFEKVDVTDSLEDKEFSFNIPVECGDLFQQFEKENVIRKHFQLAVILYRDQDQVETLRSNDVVGNIYIIHIKDRKLNSKVVYNFIKFRNNQISNINVVYNTDDEGLCVVCRTNPVNIIVLPCNHKCLCKDCLSRVSRKCPICRSTISQKFDM